MGINDPDNLYGMIKNPLMKQFMQTIKMSSGDKTPPTLDDKMKKRLEGSNQMGVFIFFLEFVWFLQQIFSAVFGLYFIAKGIASYEGILQKLPLLRYQEKAKFNEENFQILNLI